MVENFRVMDIIDQYMQASKKLIQEDFYRQSINLSWIALRLTIFKWLKCMNIPYDSSRDAFLKFIQHFPQNNISSDIWFLDTISTLCEWDENFKADISSAYYYYDMCYTVIKKIRLE